jgi:hypothetical protein
MDASAEGKELLELIKAGNFSYSDHGSQRSLERALPVSEIIHIAAHLIYSRWQEETRTHLFVGRRTNGEGGGFSAVKRNGAVIVTVFKRKLKKWEK